MALLHDLMLYLLYACFAWAVFVAIERGIYYMAAGRELKTLAGALRAGKAVAPRAGGIADTLVQAFRGPVGRSLDDAMEKAFIAVQRRLNSRLWMMDTVVTAAPLLGLLGTILGILDTFTALAKSGISDPQGVSAGIGTALIATAVGIGTALAALVVHNAFVDRVESLSDDAKLALIDLSGTVPRA
ncbi:MAG: MotA/TolQ/ExbB proton channel family protein [Ramlibacter sp.]